jgi:UPF0271 protein
VLAGSAAAEVIGGRGIRVISEGFADRAYTPEGKLAPRHIPGAVITDPAQVARRGVRLAAGLAIPALDGSEITVAADTICVHSDTAGAVELATALRGALAEAGIACRPFVPGQ